MNNNSSYPSHMDASAEETINIKSLISKLTDKWPWFIISVLFCLSIAFIYIKYTAPVYQINAKLLVNDNDKGGSLSAKASPLMDFGGLIGGKSSVDNEVEILKTRFLMEQVVRQMELNIVYYEKSKLILREINEAPFKIKLIKGVDTIKTITLNVDKATDNGLEISGVNLDKHVNWNEIFDINGVGKVQIIRTYNKTIPDKRFSATIFSIDQRVAALMASLSASVSNKQVSIIELGLQYSLPKKGEDILNALITRYNESNIEDKNTIADSTTKFIQNRLAVIARELGDVENKQQSFKQSNELTDLSEQSKMLVQTTSALRNELAKAEVQVEVVNDLEKYLKDENKNKRVFPTSLLPSDMVFSGLMNQYNALLVERDKQLLSVTEESPFIINIDNQIRSLRNGILGNVQSTKNTLVVTRNKLVAQLAQIENRVGEVPQIEKNYLILARNQQIKQELYIFLMQKAEETLISKTSNISIAKTIDPPKAEFQSVAPKKDVIMIIGLVFGISIPILLILSIAQFSTTITDKEDITTRTNVPVIGEISHNEDINNLVVANKGRSAISEQYRALRTNLSFYLKNENEKIILLTSSVSGEGKSFTAINLGNIFALTGKKVLLMELDLRKPGLSGKLGVSNKVGFSNYTIDRSVKIEDIVKPLSINNNMFIISSGPLPPNPAETLMSEHTKELIDALKKEFDYIIMDAPPVGIITDAQLLADYADVTLYLVRQRVTKKDHLAIVDDLYTSGKMKNMGIVVNDINSKSYGYGYGYGNYGVETKLPWYNRILKYLKLGN